MKYFFIPDESDEGLRLDNFLSNLFADISRAKIQALIKKGNALVDGVDKKSAYNLKVGEKIEFESEEEKVEIIIPQNIPLDIIYEDENMLVVNKPSGMLTHPTTTERENTLVNALLYKYGENLSDINGYLRRGILHRLDRNTSGLLMVAKNNAAHEFLANQFGSSTMLPSPLAGEGLGVRGQKANNVPYIKPIVKKYLAIVKGTFKDDFGTIDLPIGRHPKQPKMAVVEGGKPSITEFKVLKQYRDCTYLELDLKTGRTHQIRVHLSHLQHPILNDTMYGSGAFKVKTQEQVLQSYKLTFTKPGSSDIIELEIEPDDKIKRVLKYLES